MIKWNAVKVLSGFFSLTGFFPLYIFWTFKSFDTSKNEHSNANFDGWDGIFFFLFWLLHVKSDDDLLCCIATGLFFILSCVFFLQAFSINDNWWIWCTLWHDCLLNASTKSISLATPLHTYNGMKICYLFFILLTLTGNKVNAITHRLIKLCNIKRKNRSNTIP